MSRIATLLAVGLLGGWSPGAAQSAAPSSANPGTPSFDDQLVVTATIEAAPVDRLAATVDVIDRAEIEARQATGVLDLLRTLPGVAVAQSGSPGKVASLFVRGAGSAATLVLLDGVRVNDPVLGAFDWSAIASEGLERIEMVRGPFSALWGSSAMGGVVQLLTRSTGSSFAALTLEGGSHGQERAAVSGALPAGTVRLDLAASVWRADGEIDNDFFDGDEWRLRADWRRGGWRLGALARETSAAIGIPFDFFGAPSPARKQDSNSRLLALPFGWNGALWQVEGQLARHETDLGLADPGDPFAASTTDTRRDSGRGVVSRRFASPFWIGAGFERDRERATTGGAFGPGLDDARQTTEAVFVQAAWSGERIRADLGVRRDDNSAFGAATSRKAGVVVALGGSSRVSGRARASWGESFRAPSLGDLYYPFFGNPELEPERGESVELGFDLAGRIWTAAVVGFENNVDELIQFDLQRGLPFNIGRSRSRGVEATVARRTRTLDLRLNSSRVDAVDLDSGTPLPRRPRRSESLVATWTPADWTASAALRRVGEREDVGRVPLAGYTAVDLALSWIAGPRLRPYLRIENALDREYEEVSGFPAAGRRWVLGLRVRTGQ